MPDEKPVLDPELVEELQNIPVEDNLLTEYGSPGSQSDDSQDISFAEKWFPDKDNWQGKTIIQPKQARALAAVRAMPEVWDELEDLEPFLDSMVTDYEQYLTSIEGISRNQQSKILQAMFGGETEKEERRRDMIMSAFAGDTEDE